jgi:hypothetical protein
MHRLALLLLLIMPLTARAGEVSFHNDVMAVLSKGGCNQGTCHGNQNGKGGFKLSLRGEDAELDFAALTRDQLGRRLHRQKPEASLLLLKATATLPHEGGRRFPVGSTEYESLHQWIERGASVGAAGIARPIRLSVTPAQRIVLDPTDRVTLEVQADFADGTTRTVTRLAVFESSNPSVRITAEGDVLRPERGTHPGLVETSILVRYLHLQASVQLAFVPARPGYQWQPVPEVNFIDRHVFAQLRALQLQPSPLCEDHVFLRRAYLDALGVLPTVAETRRFLADAGPDKRAQLIDQLLERPEFADHWALKWADLLRNEEKTLDAKGVRAFHGWLRQGIAAGKPLNELARDIVAARGSTYDQPAANFYRALRDPQSRAEAVGQVFLGVRLQCAKCHNHPFDQWTQDDYHGLAACFARLQYKIVENNRKDRLDKHEFDGEQIVWLDRESEIKHPRTGAPVLPRLLAGGTSTIDPAADRLQILADWIARPENELFARTQANRVWFQLMGRGIVEPIDDFRRSNPPVNGPLLEALAKDFAAQRCDLRSLVRLIMNSRTYQLSAVPNETNRDDETHFSHALIRRLPAEPLLDAYAHVLDVPLKFNGYPEGTRAGQLAAVSQYRRRNGAPTESENFLKMFGKPERLLTCECERSDDATLVQAFRSISGEPLQSLLREPHNRLGRLLDLGASDESLLEEFYLAALCRSPSRPEREALLLRVRSAKDRRAAWEDLLWGLLNAKEFLLRR